MTRVGCRWGGRGRDCLQEQRAQLPGRLWWAGPTPADGELLCSAAATVDSGATIHAEKLVCCGEDIAASARGGGGGGGITGERGGRKGDKAGFYAGGSVSFPVILRNSFI